VEWLCETETRITAIRDRRAGVSRLFNALSSCREHAPEEQVGQPQTFVVIPKQLKQNGSTAWTLFEAWINAKQPGQSTVDRWRSVFLALDRHFEGRPASAVTSENAQAWADQLRNGKRSARTVADVWVSAARAVFRWAVKTKQLTNNPFADTEVTQPRKVRTRETDAFSPAEEKLILGAALTFDCTERAFNAARRWVPWLCAYTGARVGEITQLRGKDVSRQGGTWVIRITPEAGTVKTGTPRTVPLHDHLIAQGFISFVQSKNDGPLFYSARSLANATTVNPTNPVRPRAVKTRERLAAWVRSIGVSDKAVRPNHAWRHTFKRRAARAGIEAGIRDAICGHSPRTIADLYETPTLEDMAAAMKAFPRYEV
jgi:integrase